LKTEKKSKEVVFNLCTTGIWRGVSYSLEKAHLLTLMVFQKTLLAVYRQLQEFD